jgi:hypothetical protein
VTAGPAAGPQPAVLDLDDPQSAKLIALSRAEVARLSLELRAVRRRADDAERAAAGTPFAPPAVPSDVDAASVHDLVRSSLAHHLDARRRELDHELEGAKVEASRVIASAHRRAEAYVAAAHDDVLAALACPGSALRPLSPLPPVVVADELSSNAMPPAANETLHGLGGPETLSLVGIAAAMQSYLAASPVAAMVPALATAQVPTTAPLADAMAEPRPKSPGPALWKRLLYPDVLLPLIAAVAVLIVLLAWVG